MSRPLKFPEELFGPKDSDGVEMCLVSAPRTRPSEAQPFPFWVAVLIATTVLATGAIGARFWILHVQLAKKEEVLPPVAIHNVVSEKEPPPPLVRVSRPVQVQPVAPPRAAPTVPLPEQPEALVQAKWEPQTSEPYDPTDEMEEVDKPFPIEQPKPKKAVAKSTPKPSAPKTNRRPASRPKATPKPVVRGVSRPVRVVKRYQGPYPRSAQRAGIEGRVMLSVQIRSNGRVGSVRVSQSSGSAVLDSAAISAVKRWSFAPEQKNGTPVTSTVNVPFRYQLK